MNKNRPLILMLLIAGSAFAADLKLWYEHPAAEWIESLPVGNGRLLATNQGGVRHEIIQMNEDTLWSGHPETLDKPGGAEAIKEARRLLFAGEYKKAQQLVDSKVLVPHNAHGEQTYQTLGDLNLFFEYGDKTLEPTGYRRELDLDRAVSSVSYQMGDATYTRELFSSPVDQVIVVRLDCNQPGGLTFDARFARPGATVKAIADDRLLISGRAADRDNDRSGGVAYEAQIQFVAKGGRLLPLDDGIRVTQADSIELRIVAATDYRGDDPHAVCGRQLAAIQSKAYAKLLADHVSEHQRLFHRVEMNLVQTKKVRRLGPVALKDMPTDVRLQAFRQGIEDPELIALYYQFGRYILISCSRPGTMAINLWGKWVNTIDPAFNADYHMNINIPMNYWPTESGNLPECHEPLFDLIAALRPHGRKTAEVTYGCRGFVAHHATDAWLLTAAVGRSTHGMWSLTPAWGAHQMWQHYRYGCDREVLAAQSYPVMKEAAQFFVDYLVEDPQTGYLVSGPSTSPENTFIAPNGDRASISMAPTMDMQLIQDLFDHCIEASRILDTDTQFRAQLEQLRARLQPMQVGRDGRLMEWAKPFQETEPGHKHCSHLWGLCEGNLITAERTPKLFAAARKSLDVRVENGSAWTPVFRGNTAWITQCYVRLLAGDEAYKILRYMIADCSCPNLFAMSVQGLSRKMWETDANLGCTEAIAEMFVQSHAGYIQLLPALPAVLPDGRVKGLRAQGGFEVGLNWSNGQLDGATVTSMCGTACVLKYGERKVSFKTEAGQVYRFDKNLEKIEL